MTTPHLFCFGLGYAALALSRRLAAKGFVTRGTCRTAKKAEALREAGFAVQLFDREHPLPRDALEGVTHLLASIPPDPDGAPARGANRGTC